MLAALPVVGGAQSVFRGENLLAFADRLQASASPDAVYAALEGLFERLDIALDRRERYVHLKSAQMQRVKGGSDLSSVTSTIVLSAGVLKINKAERALVVAEGDVEIGEARSVFVIARGQIRIQRETEPGIYISKRAMEIVDGLAPIVYAVDGAKVTSKEPFTAYNTAVKIEGGFLAYKYTRAPLFQGEPVQAPVGGAMQISAGESMPFEGARCKTAIADDVNVLSQMLPYARKRANCLKVDSAAVRCEQEESGAAHPASRELWTLKLCGRSMTLVVQSKRIGKDSSTGKPTYDHSIVVQSGAQPSRTPKARPPAKPTPFPAEDALALAGRAQSELTRERVVQAVQRVLEALRLPPELRSKYAYMGSARLQLEPGYAELSELSESILVADGAVKISFARNSIVIARGPVEVAHGGGLIVIAEGSVKLSHETGILGAPFAPGVYVTRGSFEVSHSVGPVIYALQGTRPGYGRTTLINTDYEPSFGYAQPARYTVPPLFSGERPRTPVAPPPKPEAPFSYDGRRCPDVLPDEIALLLRMRAYVQKEANCTAIKSVAVQCAQAPNGQNGFTSNERWTFELCGQKLTVVYRVSGYVPPKPGDSSASAVTSSMNIERSLSPFEGVTKQWHDRYASLSDADRQQYQALSDEANNFYQQGYLVEARDKRRAADAIIGMPHPSSFGNALTIERRVEQVNAAVRPMTVTIETGKPDAQAFVARGMLYLHLRDRGRGMRDLDKAVELSRRDPAILAERAWGELVTHQADAAERTVNEALRQNPDQPRALEVRSWVHFLKNRPAEAYQDAARSLRSPSVWTPKEFAARRAGYRVMAGYFALRRSGASDQAREWLSRWKPLLDPQAWPDAGALFILGDLDEARMKAVANALEAGDHGKAVSEAFVYQVLEESESSRLQLLISRFSGTKHSSGYSLANLVARAGVRQPPK